MLYNLTCERRFHSALLNAGITFTLLELLEPSQHRALTRVGVSRGAHNSVKSSGGAAAAGVAISTAVSTAAAGAKAPSASISGTGGAVGREGTQDSAVSLRRSPSGGTRAEAGTSSAPNGVAIGSTADASDEGVGPQGPQTTDDFFDSFEVQQSTMVHSGGVEGAGGSAKGQQRPSLSVRQNVLGALMNLTTASLSHPRLDPSAVMSLLTLITQEDPSER